jgi:serine protease Do
MTAAHVVNAMDEITVEGIGGEVVRATLFSADTAADVALLQLERVTKAMRVARVGSSASVQVGEQVMVVGAPYGLSYSLSVGWISARWAANTIFRDMPLAEFFQTTATINTGNSGGRCSTWRAKSSASSARTSHSRAVARGWALS